MIGPTLALVAVSLSGPEALPCQRPTPPTAVVREASPTAWDHYERDLNIWWSRKYLADVDRRAGR